MKKAIYSLLTLIPVILFIRFVLGGSEDAWICDNDTWVKHGKPTVPMPTTGCSESSAKEATPATIANPAAVHCLEQDGELSYEEDQQGTKGLCTLPDGNVCDEWEFFRGECPQ